MTFQATVSDLLEHGSDDTIRLFVASVMHAGGEHADVLTDRQLWDVYCNADGFGRRTPDELLDLNGGWDWSHVRDSSPATYRQMLRMIGDFTAGSQIASSKEARGDVKGSTIYTADRQPRQNPQR